MKRRVHVRLEVHHAKLRDIYRDVARISEEHRGGIPSGAICNLSANGHSRLVVVRGSYDSRVSECDWIRLDETTREHLGGLRWKEPYFFELVEANWWQRNICWPWSTTEPISRIAAQLSIVSLMLGVIAFLVTLPDLLQRMQGFVHWICRLANNG
jgi:hypothetical protein